MTDESLHELEDADLVARALAQDLAAFEVLISRYQQGIYNVSYYKSKNCFDAEDLSQDIFLAAFRALSTLKDPTNFGGWLFGIAYNRCHKWFQRERTKVVKFQEIARRAEREERLSRRANAPLGAVAPSSDSEPELSQVLARLPDDVREALRLKYLEGLSYVDISERMGIKNHRIDYLIRKGKKMIRERWRAGDSASRAAGEENGA